jgi:carbon monoxide dehydrogenase subunit G
MPPLLATHRCAAAPEQVWAVAADFARAAERIPGITKVEMLTPAPVGAGTRFREWRGRQEADMEVVAWAPPRSYTLRGCAMGTEFVSELRCLPDNGGSGSRTGTRLEMEIRVRPLTVGARLLAPLIGLMSRWMVKSCAADLAHLGEAALRRERGDVSAG